jgi:hypothetical protein
LHHGPALPFRWAKAPIRQLLGQGGGRSANAAGSVANQELRVAQQLGQEGAIVGTYYMVRPTQAWSGNRTA